MPTRSGRVKLVMGFRHLKNWVPKFSGSASCRRLFTHTHTQSPACGSARRGRTRLEGPSWAVPGGAGPGQAGSGQAGRARPAGPGRRGGPGRGGGSQGGGPGSHMQNKYVHPPPSLAPPPKKGWLIIEFQLLLGGVRGGCSSCGVSVEVCLRGGCSSYGVSVEVCLI